MKDSIWFWLFNACVFCGGFILGYFIAVSREHSRRMAGFDKLKRDLAAQRSREEDDRISKLL